MFTFFLEKLWHENMLALVGGFFEPTHLEEYDLVKMGSSFPK